MTGIAANLKEVRALVDATIRQSDRRRGEVSLVAVSKTFPSDAIREVHAAGQAEFGENYLQEAVEKITSLSDLSLTWHFIGPIQSNKTAQIAQLFQWAHAVDRVKIAQRLAAQRPAHLPPLNICIQVNVSGEESKSGVAPDELPQLVEAIAPLEGISLRGLMCIPEPTPDEQLLRRRFRHLATLRDQLNEAFGLTMDTLSMGMSADMVTAIQEGATLVRVGSAIFGGRTNKSQ